MREGDLKPETWRDHWLPGQTKWHNSVLADVEYYINNNKDLSMHGLAEYLGVSRQCLYNWSFRHEGLKLQLMDMRCKSMFKMPMWGDEKTNAKNFKEL